ncbi:MAG TPA: helix-turn-helix transcriptional regulator [Rickettsiales bacterium]|nr:helix-turn-helix transcriptional regulator [Rickettsiales bacterium]
MKRVIDIHVGNQLRKRRAALGLSQAEVAKGVGMASQQVQKYEKGINAMNAGRLCEFAQFLQVPASYFFEGLDQNGSRKKAVPARPVNDNTEDSAACASNREVIEAMKSFKRIQDPGLRKRMADLLRTMYSNGL